MEDTIYISQCVLIVAPIPKKSKIFKQKNQSKYLSLIIMPYVMCPMSRVKCHLSLTPTATVTDPPPDNFPTMHGRPVR